MPDDQHREARGRSLPTLPWLYVRIGDDRERSEATSAGIALAPRHVPYVGARVVPRQPPLVARRGLGREMKVGEVDDPSRRRAEIPHAVGHPRRDAQQSRRTVTEHEPRAHALRLRALADVDEDDEHAVARRHVPDVGLARVQVERLDRPGAELAVIDLSQREARERDRKSTRLNSSHSQISYAVFCLKKKKYKQNKMQNGMSTQSCF